MIWLLDTNPCIRVLNGRSATLTARMNRTNRAEIGISAITVAELFYGSAKSQTPDRSRQKQVLFLREFNILPFNESHAEAYARIRATLEARGIPISHADIQIAAIALTHDLILVTHNNREFSRIEGLKLEDWEV
jgi:tRNA(fMet)-specific endonuclease VapC